MKTLMPNNISNLSDLPPFGKLFVGIFTTLVLLVCLWAILILYMDKGMVDESTMPQYSTTTAPTDEPSLDAGRLEVDVKEVLEDSLAVLAPVWDTNLAGEEVVVDSTALEQQFAEHSDEAVGGGQNDAPWEEDEFYHLRENVGLAHTHINGQTLLFFALGLVYLFTSATPKMKKLTFPVFGAAIVLHAVGLTGEGFHRVFDDLVVVGGVIILVCILYMALMIYADLGKKGKTSH